MSYLVGHFDRCTGCSICQLACSAVTHHAYNPRHAHLDIQMSDDGLIHYPVVCRQCKNAFCEKVCPVSAIQRNKATGALEVDRETCIGCGTCKDACPIGMSNLYDRKAFKCDLCQGDPQCVALCPVEALEFIRTKEA